MSFVRREPGFVFTMLFAVIGLTLVVGVSIAEDLSPVAGQVFGGGIIDGAPWQATEFPPVTMN